MSKTTRKLAAIFIGTMLGAMGAMAQDAPMVKGAVAKPGAINASSLKGLDRHIRMVKITDVNGKYLGAMELSGYALKDVLERNEPTKQDDGFNRPLDLVVTAKGRDGRSALFSYGEVFFSGDEGVLLADRARMVLSYRHVPLKDKKNDPSILMDIKKRDSIDLNSCASCHDGRANLKLHLPKGWLLIRAGDGFPSRYVENLAEINISQVGIKVEDARTESSRDSIVESPVIVGPDGKTHAFSLEDYQKLPRVTHEDAAFGHGRAYRGTSTWEGAPLKGLLQGLLPSGTDPRNTYVLVTAADGYRSTFSGAEVFNKPNDKCVLLIDRKDGEPLGRGSGLYTVVQRDDFYVDRNVRMVKEIRLIVR